MKKITYFIYFFLSLNIYTQSILTGEIVYKISLNTPDFSKLDSTRFSKENINRIKNDFKQSEDVSAILIFNNHESLYYVIDKMSNDSEKKINFAKIFAGNNDKLYVSRDKNESFTQTAILGEVMRIEMISKEWKLTQITKMILGYKCYKAIDSQNDKIEAWYAPEILLNFGPKNYFGLPGLILEVTELNKITITTSRVKLNSNIIKILKPKEGRRVTAKEYNDIKKKNSPFKN